MNYHNITTDDMLNGDGLRVVLWVAGCTHQCKGCQNPITWDITGGLLFDEQAENELFSDLDKPYISGLTFSGGDPLHPFNKDEITRIAKKAKEIFPNKTIWLYTGFSWDEVKDYEIMSYLDVVVEGEFVEHLKDNNLKWVGSSNQKVVDVQKSIKEKQLIEF